MNNTAHWVVGFVTGLIAGVLLFFFVYDGNNVGNVHTNPRVELAERINRACKPGYRMIGVDVRDDSLDPLPGFVMVSCWSIAEDKDGHSKHVYSVAVGR